jgi:hypothetical protein
MFYSGMQAENVPAEVEAPLEFNLTVQYYHRIQLVGFLESYGESGRLTHSRFASGKTEGVRCLTDW